MAISRKELQTAEDLERFWRDPFGCGQLDYADKPATDLTDFVAHGFALSYIVPNGCIDDDESINITDHNVYKIRDQFVETLMAYARGLVDHEGSAQAGESVTVGDTATGEWLGFTWSVEAEDGITFVLTTDGMCHYRHVIKLDPKTLDPKPGGTGPIQADELENFGYLNNTTYVIVKLWRLANLCRQAKLDDVSTILLTTLDAVGDQHGDLDLLAKQVQLFRRIQESGRRSSLARLADASRQ